MKVANAYSIVSVLTVLAFGALSVNAATTALPFADGFESGFDGSGSGVWSTNSSGDHVAAAGAAAAETRDGGESTPACSPPSSVSFFDLRLLSNLRIIA